MRNRKKRLSRKEWLTSGKGFAVARENAVDHGLLREVHEDSFAKRFGAGRGGCRIIESFLDRIGHGVGGVRRKQRVLVLVEDFGDTADIGGKQKQIQADQQAIADAEDDLRKSGGDSGWAR